MMSWATLDEFVEKLPEMATGAADKLRGADGTFELKTEQRTVRLQLWNGTVKILDSLPGPADCFVEASEQLMLDLLNGKTSPLKAIMLGRVKVRGDKMKLLKLAALA